MSSCKNEESDTRIAVHIYYALHKVHKTDAICITVTGFVGQVHSRMLILTTQHQQTSINH